MALAQEKEVSVKPLLYWLLVVLFYFVCQFYVCGCCIPRELSKNYDNLKITFNVAVLPDHLRTVFDEE